MRSFSNCRRLYHIGFPSAITRQLLQRHGAPREARIAVPEDDKGGDSGSSVANRESAVLFAKSYGASFRIKGAFSRPVFDPGVQMTSVLKVTCHFIALARLLVQ